MNNLNDTRRLGRSKDSYHRPAECDSELHSVELVLSLMLPRILNASQWSYLCREQPSSLKRSGEIDDATV